MRGVAEIQIARSKPMSEASENRKQEEIVLAKEAVNEGRLTDAMAHIANAKHEGATEKELRRLRVLMNKNAEAQERHKGWGSTAGFLIAMTVYLAMVFMNIPRLGWLPIALLIVPGASGYCAGRLLGDATGRAGRFWIAFRAVGFAMALFGFVNMLVVRSRFPAEGQASEAFLLAVVVPLIYGAVAGSVAGLFSALAWRNWKENHLVDHR